MHYNSLSQFFTFVFLLFTGTIWAESSSLQTFPLAYFSKPVALFDSLQSRNSSCNIRLSEKYIAFFCADGYVAVNALETFIQSNMKISASKAMKFTTPTSEVNLQEYITIVSKSSISVILSSDLDRDASAAVDLVKVSTQSTINLKSSLKFTLLNAYYADPLIFLHIQEDIDDDQVTSYFQIMNIRDTKKVYPILKTHITSVQVFTVLDDLTKL